MDTTQTQDVAGLNAARESAVSSGQNAYGGNLASLSSYQAANPPGNISQTQSASDINNHLSGNTTTAVIPPPPPAPTKGVSANTSVTNPIPTPQDIIGAGNAQTPGEKTNQGLLEKVAALVGQKKSQTGLTNTAEANAGIPAMSKTVNDLNTQLEGLNNQALDLQNQAGPGGAIQNQEQQNAEGRGITAAGLAPQTAGDLRKNQIQQSAIASHALTLKSAIYGAQGQLSLAKDAADKAALAQYEDQQNQIDYQKALIDANMPQMNKEEKNQALLIQTQLADRQTQIQQAQDDKKSIIALATAAISNNPNNPAAQYAAQQALAESNKQQPNIQAALVLVGKYQKDPLDVQAKILAIQNTRLTNQKLTQELAIGGTLDASTLKTGDSLTNNTSAITGLIKKNKVNGAAQTQLGNILSVIDGAAALAKNNPDAAFEGVFPGGGLVNAAKSLVGAKGQKAIENQGSLDAINLRVQQWASGASLTAQQISQVNKLVPNVNDSDTQVRDKLNSLSNFMLTQAQGTLQGAGVSFVPQRVDLFANATSGTVPEGYTKLTGPGGTFNVPNTSVALFKSNGYQ